MLRSFSRCGAGCLGGGAWEAGVLRNSAAQRGRQRSLEMRGILLLLAFAFTNAQASVDFKNAEFGLKLGSDWTRTILIGAEHLYFSSKTAQVSIKADSLRPKVRPENFRKIAQALIER
jgi:hypothetical protein